MKGNLKQLCAINYAYSKKRKEETEKELDDIGLLEVFYIQSHYKTKGGFLKALKSGKNVTVVIEIIKAFEKLCDDIRSLFMAGCSVEEVEDLFQLKNKIKNAIENIIGKENAKKWLLD